MKKGHSHYYYEKGRNEGSTNNTWQDDSIDKINPKMLLSKDKLDYSKDKIPNYYIGKTYGYEARKVVEDCIQKAINHLEFELDKIKNEKTNL